jgi:hypothetical protein
MSGWGWGKIVGGLSYITAFVGISRSQGPLLTNNMFILLIKNKKCSQEQAITKELKNELNTYAKINFLATGLPIPSSEARLLTTTGPGGPFTMGGVLHMPNGSVIGSN